MAISESSNKQLRIVHSSRGMLIMSVEPSPQVTHQPPRRRPSANYFGQLEARDANSIISPDKFRNYLLNPLD